MNEFVFKRVKNLFEHDNSGHGIDHIVRVHRLSMDFAEKEGADKDIVELAALLHDVDDYKLFGEDNARELTNANRILDEAAINTVAKRAVLEVVRTMGYNKYLEGIRPVTIEGMIVSDADMCDSLGAQGILRTNLYSASIGNPFFDPNLKPITKTMSAEEYRALRSGHSVQHFFDKLLKISLILMTESGREEGEKRQKIMVDFLGELFREENAGEWTKHLDGFLTEEQI